MEDYSAVIVTGSTLADYLADKDRRKYLHPELQAELEFGVDQSMDCSYDNFIENYETFIENSDSWEEVNRQIVEIREEKEKIQFPGIELLSECVDAEIDYVSALWAQDYEKALGYAESILGIIVSPELRGYRALWEYLAGSAAYMAENAGKVSLSLKVRDHYQRAKNAAKDIPWLALLSGYTAQVGEVESINELTMRQIEQIESHLESIGKMHDRKLAKLEKEIREGINSSKDFEKAHKLIGRHIGFDAHKHEADASPDPWWQIGNICFVFEDHADAESDTLSATKARQDVTHPNWIKENVKACQKENMIIIPVLISPVTKVKSGGKPHLNGVSFWSLDNFKEWVNEALRVIRELRTTFVQPGDLIWRKEAYEKLTKSKLDVYSLQEMFKHNQCSNILEVVK
ncbi:hypothetical protein [Legionella feeleii]|uniref:Uncharacterized protein n=1 Tax=Legionella feeleii TaxID=453 RepID=A0A378IVX3_9GAMM|nr:hypothetical protein [Legionella feeleii]STX39309.1 Uncharacterised protein [Legionella feeleii]